MSDFIANPEKQKTILDSLAVQSIQSPEEAKLNRPWGNMSNDEFSLQVQPVFKLNTSSTTAKWRIEVSDFTSKANGNRVIKNLLLVETFSDSQRGAMATRMQELFTFSYDQIEELVTAAIELSEV